VTLCATVALSAALIVAGPAAPTFAVVAPALSSAMDVSFTTAPLSVERSGTTVTSSETPSPGHQTHPHSTATPRADGRGVPTGGGEVAPVLGVSAVAMILGGALVTLLVTARRTRHLRKGQEGDR
jgi:hypothetical protein